MKAVRQAICAGSLVGLVVLAGCSVRVNKDGDGREKDVSIHVPFAGLQVHKDGQKAVDTGMPVYPGAVLEASSGDDNKTVDVQMGFGPWQMHIQVANYVSKDPQAKVQAFYTRALAQYGNVLTCRGSEAVGLPTRTSAGLTCRDDEAGKHIHVAGVAGVSDVTGDNSDAKLELKAGSARVQHIVGFKQKDSDGTHFSLVSIALPDKDSSFGIMTSRDGNGKEKRGSGDGEE